MDTKPNTDKNTPAKPMQNILLEKAAQGKLPLPFGCDSPFRILPPASTPPSRVTRIKNPFESQLTERLHHHVFSPSVFTNATCSKTEEKFRWAIEDISSLKPADIDETAVEQFESTDHDSELELTAQANIEKYFSEKHIVPSPFDAVLKSVPLISESTSPMKMDEPQFVDGMAQTILTLPPDLPKHIETVLKPYFSYTVNQQREEPNTNCTLYRRLFEYDAAAQSPDSVLTSPAPSCGLSPIDFSPLDANKMQTQRHFGSPHDIDQMAECNLSPIDLDAVQLPTRPTSVTRLNFSGRMSVDVDRSLNLVPDTLDQMPSNNQSIAFESMHSPIPEALSNSSINWDMEYKHVSLESPQSSNSSVHENEMDMSNFSTPKSKIFMSQRKKLSDSFLKIEESDERHENKENIYEMNSCSERRAVKNNLFVRDDTTDIGYHTGVGLTMSEESWSSSHLFASTPTKSKSDKNAV